MCSALWTVLRALSCGKQIASLAIDGTSSTALLVDSSSGALLANPKMYNEAQSPEATAAAAQLAPEGHTASSSTSTLAKLLSWQLSSLLQQARPCTSKPRCLGQPSEVLDVPFGCFARLRSSVAATPYVDFRNAVQVLTRQTHSAVGRSGTLKLHATLDNAWAQPAQMRRSAFSASCAAAQALDAGRSPQLLHQADWLAWLLHGRGSCSDWSNCLKLGFDPGLERYPDWLAQQVQIAALATP